MRIFFHKVLFLNGCMQILELWNFSKKVLLKVIYMENLWYGVLFR